MTSRKSRDLVLLAGLTAVAVALSVLLAPEAARALGGLLLVLVLPGYALSLAIFPPRSIPALERGVLSLGLSLALVALSGLVLHWTPGGLRSESWAILLGGIYATGCLVGLVRWWRRAAVDDPDREPGASPRLRIRDATLLAAALLVGCAAVWTSTAGAVQPRSGFTQLWIEPAQAAPSPTVHVGVRNMELASTEYQLRVSADGVPIQVLTGIRLEPGQSWQTVVRVDSSGPQAMSPSATVEAVLALETDPTVPYRHVFLHRDAEAEPTDGGEDEEPGPSDPTVGQGP